MKLSRCLQKLHAPLLGVAFGIAAFGLSTQSAKAVAAQGCVKVNGVLTAGVKVDVFDNSTCTVLASGFTFGAGGDFVIRDATGFANNPNVYLMLTTPDGCIEIVDNATVRSSIITDPNDPRFCWIALCTDILGKPVQCTTGVTRVVLQYLGTSEQVVGAWATATTGSKGKTSGSKSGATKPGSKTVASTKPSSKSSDGTKSGSKTTGSGSKAPATPLFCATLKPCSTFSITLPNAPVAKGSKAVWKLGSKNHPASTYLIKPGSKAAKAGSKSGKTGALGGLTLFVGNNVNTRIDLNCASGVEVGKIYGMFRVIRLEDACGNRICPAPKNPNCTTVASPNVITFKYTGGNCATAHNSQTRGANYNCVDATAASSGPVKVVFSRTASLSQKFYWTTVPVGQCFSVRAPARGTNLGPKLYAFIFSGATQIECVQIDTSCSAPLIRGETFGGLKLVDYAIAK